MKLLFMLIRRNSASASTGVRISLDWCEGGLEMIFHTHTKYIYIYIYRERERERERDDHPFMKKNWIVTLEQNL